MAYRPGDYWLTDDRTGFDVRRSDAVVEAETGFVVARGTDDPKHPLEAILRPRKAYAPRLVRPEPADSFLDQPEATLLFSLMTTQPSATRKSLYNSLITSLKTTALANGSGVLWDALDSLWIMAAHDSQAAGLNIRAPWAYSLTPVASPTFTTDRGYQGNGSTQYIRTGFAPASAAGAFTLDGAHIGIWSRTDAAGGMVDIGANDASSTRRTNLQPRITTGMIGRINQTSSGAQIANASSLGHHVAVRASSAGTTLYARGSSLGNGGGASTQLLTSELYLLANNNDGSPSAFSTRQLAAAHVGGSLGATDVASLETILETWMTAVGA